MAKNKPGAGRPQLYGEPTKRVIKIVPVSKLEDFEQKVKTILKRYQKEAKQKMTP